MRVVKDYEGSAVIIGEIDKTHGKCVLVSPYVKLWDRLQSALERAVERGVDLEAFIREPENDQDKNQVELIASDFAKIGIRVNLVKNLHAKIYSFDQSVIVSSMNLYDFSQRNSIELSVLVDDDETVTEIKDYIKDHIVRVAKPYKGPPVKAPKATPQKQFCKNCGAKLEGVAQGKSLCVDCFKKEMSGKTSSENTEPEVRKSPPQRFADRVSATIKKRDKYSDGYCIRCRKIIEDNPEHPLCPSCYKKWAVYQNPIFEEKYCHACGTEYNTSMAKPICLKCFKKSTN
jgi:phosphatidylserine/phosphatidylglycerophosphate/cardiolipin synthase-like enzyme